MSDPKYKYIGNPAIRLMEECAELIKALSKAERFGWGNFHPNNPNRSNLESVEAEMEDIKEAYADLMEVKP